MDPKFNELALNLHNYSMQAKELDRKIYETEEQMKQLIHQAASKLGYRVRFYREDPNTTEPTAGYIS